MEPAALNRMFERVRARLLRLVKLPYHPIIWRLNRNERHAVEHADTIASRLDAIERRLDQLALTAVSAESPAPRRPARPTHLPTCIVYGNCQATALGGVLARSPAFAAAYQLVPAPAAHDVVIRTRESGPEAIERLHQTVANASLLLTQSIGRGYHGLPLGTEDLLEVAASDCVVLTLPVLYHDALFPFTVYVRIEGEHFHTGAPLVDYHDLRFLYCASRKFTYEQSVQWLHTYEPPAAALQRLASRADASLRDAVDRGDFPLTDAIVDRQRQLDHWFTVNHPSDVLMDELAASVHARLGLAFTSNGVSEFEYLLSSMKAPVEAHTLRGLGIDAAPREGWLIRYQHWAIEKLLSLHMKFYEARPDVVEAGVAEHADRMELLALS